MARNSSNSNAAGGCFAFVFLLGLMAYAGATACYILGGLLVLGGFGYLGDRRRNPFTAFGFIAFGVVLCFIGFALSAGRGTPAP